MSIIYPRRKIRFDYPKTQNSSPTDGGIKKKLAKIDSSRASKNESKNGNTQLFSHYASGIYDMEKT